MPLIALYRFQPFALSSAIFEDDMLKKEPGQQLAFLATTDVDALAESLVAFTNNDGGLIVLALDELGQLTESIWEEALREAASLCRPPLPNRWQPVETTQETLVDINVLCSQ
jgi:hypothetical protein